IGGTLVGVSVAGQSATAAVSPLQAAANSAANFIASRGERGAVAVVDRTTGAYVAAGDSRGMFASASVVKVFIATRLLAEGKMTGATAATAYRMITQSDDNAADQLYGLVGGDGLGPWIQAHYDVPVGRPADPGWWGETQISAQGLVLFYQRVMQEPGVGPWLLNAMSHYACTAADGWPQCYGIPAVAGGAAIKQGWMCCLQNLSRMHSTGLVGHGRYAIAILTEGPTRYYGPYGRDTVTGAAARLMPGGIMPAESDPHNPGGHFDTATAIGSSVSLTGWAADKDSAATSIHVDVYEGSTGVGRFTANVSRPDVTKSTGIAGQHGYVIHFAARDGTHNYCAYAINVGPGGNVSLGCRTVTVHGGPVGHFDGITAKPTSSASGPASVTLTGWAYDPDSPATALRIDVYVGSTQLGSTMANRSRPDVNQARKVPGAHGFSATVRAVAGTNRYCAYAINVGPPTHNPLLGCATVAVR
ncbi:MAG: Lipoprotein LppW, partial [Frankiales bacterium]|nr:Lipoprotein LppW [Frankiales bacterium]